jgi:hypothetical protein
MKKEQQQLGRRNTCTPTNVSLVCSPVVLTLNKEETLSEQDLKTLPNNLEVNLHQHIGVQTFSGIVYVKSREGKPLMPTTSPKTRRLLAQEKAKVVMRKPYTIQLLVSCRGDTQEVLYYYKERIGKWRSQDGK